MTRAGLGLTVAAALALAACGGGNDAGPDAAACTVPAGGQCDGLVLSTCVDGELHTENCGDTLASCQYSSTAGAYACVDECVEAGVDAPTCVNGALRHCALVDGHHVVVTEACGLGETCVEPAGQPATCEGDPCVDVGPLGRCDGDTLVTCAGGTPSSTSCAGSGQVCAYAGDTTGYACVAPGSTGAMVVTGTLRYEDRPPLTSGALGGIVAVVSRGAQVSVVTDSGSTVLATAHTSDDGSYTLRYDTSPGTMVHIMATAQNTTSARPIRVMRTNSQLHAFGGASFAAAASTSQDVLVTDSSALSEAFNILDMGVLAMDVIRSDFGDPTPVRLTARWARGSNNGTYYSGNTIYLLGANSDDDGYDDTVILHEIGHFVEDTEGRTDSPGGGHDGSPTDPNLAWSEGFSTYFAMAVRQAPYYMDSNSGGGWGYNGDTAVTRANGSGPIDQDVSEDMVTECLWDLGDGGANDDDPLSTATHAQVLAVQPDYLRTATLRSVGEAGVDLVDFLDGWFLSVGLGTCNGVRSVVTTTRLFPYDYAGPAGPCP